MKLNPGAAEVLTRGRNSARALRRKTAPEGERIARARYMRAIALFVWTPRAASAYPVAPTAPSTLLLP